MARPDEAPYAFQVRSFEGEEEARRLAEALRRKGRKAFVGQATARNGSTWHRVYVGAYGSPTEADAERSAFEDDVLAGVFLVYLPFCVEIADADSPSGMAAAESRLSTRGFIPYRLPPRSPGASERLAVGGFYKKRDAQALLGQLHRHGFDASLSRR